MEVFQTFSLLLSRNNVLARSYRREKFGLKCKEGEGGCFKGRNDTDPNLISTIQNLAILTTLHVAPLF